MIGVGAFTLLHSSYSVTNKIENKLYTFLENGDGSEQVILNDQLLVLADCVIIVDESQNHYQRELWL